MSAEPRPLVLIADDDAGLRILCAAGLEEAGFQVAEAADGSDALADFQRIRPDLLILDVDMPLVNGFEVCSTLRSTASGSTTPVLIMTGLDDLASIERAFDVGATDFITKPVQPVLLGHRARYLVRASQAQAGIRLLDRAEAISRSEPHDVEGPIDTMVIEGLRSMKRQQQSILSQVINAYLFASPQLIDRLREAASKGDEAELQHAAQALKSSSSNVGARYLSELCKQLEDEARAGDIEDAVVHVARIESEFQCVHVVLMPEIKQDSG